MLIVVFASTSMTDAQKCKVMYKNRMIRFPNCKVIGGSGIKVFWRVLFRQRKIMTLIRAKHNGYIAFGWGYSQMIGSQAMVTFLGRKGKNMNFPYLRTFNLNAKMSSAVKPVSGLSAADYKNGYLSAMFVQPLKPKRPTGSVITPGKLTFAIWSKGKKPPSNRALVRHFNRGVIPIKV